MNIDGQEQEVTLDELMKGYSRQSDYTRKTEKLSQDRRSVEELKNENLIVFKYCDAKGNIKENSNPNGSLESIAGILNSKKNILGMMPHPERMIDEIISNKDGINLFKSLLNKNENN